MKKPINVLIVGTGMYTCGRGTKEFGTIMPAILEYKRNNPLGDIFISATSPSSAKDAKVKINSLMRKMGLRANIKYFTGKMSYEKAASLISKPAVGIIAVPDEVHKKVATSLINHGIHTLVTKPLAPTLKDVNELIKIQNRRKVYCSVEFHKRFDRANLKLKDSISKRLIGEPVYFLVEYSQRKVMPTKHFKKWASKTNVFQYLGIHYADIIYFVTKAKPLRVMAIGQKNWLSSKGIGTYDAIQVFIEWTMPTTKKKFISCIVTNWIDPDTTSAMSDQKIKVIGTKGRFESDQKKRGIMSVADDKSIEEPNPYFCSTYDLDGKLSYFGYGIDSIHQFLKDVIFIDEGKLKIRDLENTRPTFKQSIVPTTILEGVNKSLNEGGKWIQIK